MSSSEREFGVKRVGRKIPRGGGQWKNQDQEIEPISFPLLNQ